MKVETSGMDLARELFQMHGVDDVGKTRLCKTLRRGAMSRVFSNRELCLFGLEACGGARNWARELRKLGHDVQLIAPQFVAPCRKNDRSNGNDAETIGEAVARPTMRFVTIKDTEQQAVLVLPRVCERVMGGCTALINQTRGSLTEFGITVAQRGGLAACAARPRRSSKMPTTGF
jgi:transposase